MGNQSGIRSVGRASDFQSECHQFESDMPLQIHATIRAITLTAHSMQTLLQYAQTDRQREIIEAIIEHGSQRKAAKALNIANGSITSALDKVKRHAAQKGHSPEHNLNYPLAPAEIFNGRSIQTRDANGDLVWIKTRADKQQQFELIKEAIEALCADIKPVGVVDCPNVISNDLLNVYVITDYHLNMRSWSSETGADWDMEIAENLLYNWFAQAIKQSPDSETAVFAQLGDLLHSDGWLALTPASGHVLDVDTRFQKAIRVAIRAIRRVIDMLLKKHNHVHLIMADANHDPASGAWLREMLVALYENEPRITVDNSADTYYAVEHGLTSLYFHHGHKRGVANVDSVFAAKFRELYGRTKYAYAHLGHLHSNESKESNLMMVERHRTLAAPDAYASKGGWISGRDAKVITYHKKYGEVSRITVSPDMVM